MEALYVSFLEWKEQSLDNQTSKGNIKEGVVQTLSCMNSKFFIDDVLTIKT